MPRLPWLHLLAAASCTLASAPSLAATRSFLRHQTPYAIDVWENDDGLPQNAVISIIQTRDGYLWLGTLEGLVRFDGIRFTVYDESNTPGLPSSRVVHLFEDSRGALWVGTETAGTALIQNGRISTTSLGPNNREGRVIATCEDATGAVWLYTANGTLARFHTGQSAPRNADPDSPTSDVWNVGASRPSKCRAVIAEPQGPVRVGMDWLLLTVAPAAIQPNAPLPAFQTPATNGLDFLLASQNEGYWRFLGGRIQKCTGDRVTADLGEYPWGRSPVSAACEDAQGHLVVGTLGDGVYWFDADGRFLHLRSDPDHGLSHNFILSLCVDREGSLWIGTDGGGLNRIRQRAFTTVEPTRNQVVQTTAPDSHGGLWIGYNGGGIDHWSPASHRRYGQAEGLPDRLSIRALIVDSADRLWVGTWGGGLFQLEGERFRRAPASEHLHPVVLALHEDPAGNLWAGTQGGLARFNTNGWRLFTTRDGLSSDAVTALATDRDGALWAGTEAGLNRLHADTITTVTRQEGLPGDTIASLLVDSRGDLWAGTYGTGLARYHNNTWFTFTTRSGLPSNTTGVLLEDDQEHLWIGSRAGLARASLKALDDLATDRTRALPLRIYGRPDGLPTRECTLGSQPSASRTLDGRLWFPTIKGLASAHTAALLPNPHKPPVVIEGILVDGQPQGQGAIRSSWPDPVVIGPGRERLEIQYTSLNLAAPDSARFRYQLEDHETSWTEAGTIRLARYSRLPPGRYRFRVAASNEDGVWNEAQAAINLLIEPPFWQSAWFLASSTLLLLGSIVAVVHYVSTQKLHRQLEHLRQQEALEKERARIARDIHDQLGANLTQVALLGEMAESDKDLPSEIEEHARQIVQTARETTRALDEIVWTVNPSNDTLEGLANYACKYAQDYLALAGLRYRLDVPPNLPPIPIPPEIRHNLFLAFKESINNVVKHAQASCARIRLVVEPASFAFEIIDDGRGPGDIHSDAARGRNGLRNMRRRMEDLGGSFSIGPAPERGTVVRLTAPLARP